MQLAHRQVQLSGIAVAALLEGQQVLHVAHRHLNRPLLPFGPVGSELQRRIAEASLGLGHQGLGPVAAINRRSLAPIFSRLQLSLLDQLFDLLGAEVGPALNAHALLAAGGAVHRRHLKQAIGIDVERHLHLGHPAGRGRDAGQAEATQALVALRHLALPLEHVDLHRALIGLRRTEYIALAHRDRRVARDQHLHHAADRLQAQ